MKLNLTREECIVLAGLIRDGIMHRQKSNTTGYDSMHVSPEEDFLLNYALVGAGFAHDTSPKLRERLEMDEREDQHQVELFKKYTQGI
jgi:hypothetical protein